MYWIYRTYIFSWHNKMVQAKLISPDVRELKQIYGARGYTSGLQNTPYGFGPDDTFTFEVNSKHPHPDNYVENVSFCLYSERLVKLLQSFDVKSEIFPVKMVNENGEELPELKYYIFHNLEGTLMAMDEAQSGWTGDFHDGVPKLVLKSEGFEQRPIFTCNNLYVTIMRDDVKKEIQNEGITGFAFLAPDRFRSGKYGFPPDFEV